MECLQIMMWVHQWTVYTLMLSYKTTKHTQWRATIEKSSSLQTCGVHLMYDVDCSLGSDLCLLMHLTWTHWNVLYLLFCRLNWACSHNTNRGQEWAESHGNFFKPGTEYIVLASYWLKEITVAFQIQGVVKETAVLVTGSAK